jgi:hypothetical protein
VAHSPETDTDKPESLQGLRFSKGVLIPEVVLAPFAEIFRLPLGILTGQGLMSGCIRSMVSALLFISTSFFSAIF